MDFIASIRHAGGAARLIEASGPRQFKEPFAYTMFHTLQGAIVSLIHGVPVILSYSSVTGR